MNYTPKQLQILQMIYQFQQQHNYSPTYAELAAALKVSTITVFEHLEALERKGAIRRRRHEARSVEIVEEKFLAEARQRAGLQIRGALAARGTAPDAALGPTEELTLAAVFGSGPNTYVLRVIGDSMAADHILDGDLIVIAGRQDGSEVSAGSGDIVDDGQTVVVLDDSGQPRLKRLYREGGKIRLQDSNPKLPSVIADRVRIKGIYKGLLRRAR